MSEENQTDNTEAAKNKSENGPEVVDAVTEQVAAEDAVAAAEASTESEEAPKPPSPLQDQMQWFIVNCQTSCENVAKRAIEERVRSGNKDDYFGEILVPSENVVQLIKGKKQTRARKFFPGYIFVQMVMNDGTWHLVRKSSKVTGFIGGEKPQPVTQEEVNRVTNQMVVGAAKPKPRISFNVGDSVTVIDGPFSNFNGSVEEINEEKAKVKVSVSIFGRPTPVELDFIQVEKN